MLKCFSYEEFERKHIKVFLYEKLKKAKKKSKEDTGQVIDQKANFID